MVSVYPDRSAFLCTALIFCACMSAGCGASLNDGIHSGLVDEKAGAGANSLAAPVPLPQAAAVFTAAATPGNSSYKIGPQDVLDITVFKVQDLSRSVRVSDTGTISFPLVGEVTAAGKTAREVETILTKSWAKYLQSPQVSVSVKEFNSRRVTIDGAVNKPGVYPILNKTSLLQFIAIAGGPTDGSDTSDIVVFREIAGKRSAARFDLDEIRAGRSQDPALEEGDVVVVNTSAMKTTFNYILKVLPVTSLFVPLL